MKKEGFQKKDGYNPKLLKEIYDWERSDVEDKIWVKFHENDGSLVDFLPQLKKYDGITALKNCKYLKNIPSFASVNTARVLYECTLDSKYLFIIKDNINTAKDSMEYVSILVRCTPSATWKELLKEIYINSNDNINRNIVIWGLLYSIGRLKEIGNSVEIRENRELINKFRVDDKEQRIQLVKQYFE